MVVRRNTLPKVASAVILILIGLFASPDRCKGRYASVCATQHMMDVGEGSEVRGQTRPDQTNLTQRYCNSSSLLR